MAVEIVMPKWGLSMQEGTIANWLKAEGDEVQAGEELVEIETEKITNVVEAPASGILARIIHPQGVKVPVTHIIAIITAPGEPVPAVAPSAGSVSIPKSAPEQKTVSTAPAITPAAASNGKVRVMPVARKMAKEHGLNLATIQGTGRGGAITKEDVEKAIAAAKVSPPGKVRAMPVARKMAKEHGLNLTTIQGTGRGGAITKEDVEQALATSTALAVKPVQKVSFYSAGHKLAGLLYSPPEAAAGDNRPAVVLCVGYTYLKEMVMPDIAKQLNKAGYVVLIFDYRGFGESEGPRWRLIPQEQINDIRAALTFIAEQPHVNPERLAVLGLSLGGAHAITVGATDERVGAVVALEPVGDGRRWLRTLRRHSEWMDFESRLAADRTQRVLTGQSERVDPLEIVLPDPASQAFLEAVGQEFPQMTCELPLETAEALLEYSPEAVVAQLDPTPLLIIHGEEDRLVPAEESVSMIEFAGDAAWLELVPGMDHFNWVMPHSPGFAEVMEMVMIFMTEHFPAS